MSLLAVSAGLQLVLAGCLACVAVVLARRLARLQGQLVPLGALAFGGGPAVGAVAPVLLARLLDGGAAPLGGAGARTLLLFVAPGCPLSRKLLPVARRLAGAERLRLVLASDGDAAALREMAGAAGVPAGRVVNDEAVGRAYGVGRLPHAVLVSADGRIEAAGLVNSREHLESLLGAAATGYGTLQAYMGGTQAVLPGRHGIR